MSRKGLSEATRKRTANICLTYGCDLDPNCYVYLMIDGVKTLVDTRPGLQKLKGEQLRREWNQQPVVAKDLGVIL